MVFRDRVTAVMADRGIKPIELAKAVGRSPAWASTVLSGSRSVPLRTADRIASFLQVSLANLLQEHHFY